MDNLDLYYANLRESYKRAEQNREVVQETPFQEYWDPKLAEKWKRDLDGFLENRDVNESPIRSLDLSSEGLGNILVKDESDRTVNPTGTMKDRIARDLAIDYWVAAKNELEYTEITPDLSMISRKHLVPRYSLLTSGNAGMALALASKKLGLPPIKLLFDSSINPKIIESIKQTGADIYTTNLSVNPFSGRSSKDDPLTPWQIKFLTNNSQGRDLTSAGGANMSSEYQALFYRSLATDIFKERPDEIYAPFGGGVLYGDLMASQFLAADENRISKNGWQVTNIKIFGGEPADPNSIADKLTAPAKPFIPYGNEEIEKAKKFNYTNQESGVFKVSEAEILEAFNLLKQKGRAVGLEAEPSAAAGLALYIKRKRNGQVPEKSKVVVINTGKGIVLENYGP